MSFLPFVSPDPYPSPLLRKLPIALLSLEFMSVWIPCTYMPIKLDFSPVNRSHIDLILSPPRRTIGQREVIFPDSSSKSSPGILPREWRNLITAFSYPKSREKFESPLFLKSSQIYRHSTYWDVNDFGLLLSPGQRKLNKNERKGKMSPCIKIHSYTKNLNYTSNSRL